MNGGAHVGERRGDDSTDTEVEERPGGVLARATASKVAAGNDEDLGLAVRRLVEDKLGLLLARLRVVPERGEERDSETSALDCTC